MSDTISRKAAIDAIMCEPTDAHYPSWYADMLEKLPSAQPEPLSDAYTKVVWTGREKEINYEE